jgi:hypothetical protein
MLNHNFTLFISGLLLLSGCTSSTSNETSKPCARKYEVHLYATNWSSADSLSAAYLSIDDSTYIEKVIDVNKTGSERFQKMVWLCEGSHSISSRFGQYKKDTVLTITANSSLLISMNYNPKWEPQDNGMMLNLLVRDGVDRGGD